MHARELRSAVAVNAKINSLFLRDKTQFGDLEPVHALTGGWELHVGIEPEAGGSGGMAGGVW